MTRLADDTDLSADQWALIAPYLPAAQAGGRSRWGQWQSDAEVAKDLC